MDRHDVLVVALVLVGVLLFLMALLIWAEFTGFGKPMRDLNERQKRSMKRDDS